jgi:uridine kinase
MTQESSLDPARLVVIAGGSCSGKTTLARALEEALIDAVVVSMDWYYRDLAHLRMEERAAYNFDHPEAIDVGLLKAHLTQLRSARAIEAPFYDFATHTRAGRGQKVSPARHIILEGIHGLYWAELRSSADTRVFIELDQTACLTRRVDRDVRERGRDRDSVSRQFRSTVVPMYEAHVALVREHADIVVRGDAPVQASVDRIVRHLMRATPKKSEPF